MNKLGANIKFLRTNLGLTQLEFAKAINISNTTLSQYETGKRIPSDDVKIIMADFFGVSVDYLLGRTNLKSSLSDNNKNQIDKTPLDQELEQVLKKLESDGSALMYKGEPLNDATKEALLISLKNTLELADKMHKMDKKNN